AAAAQAPRAHVLVIAGASGEPAYAAAFHQAATAIAEAARTRLGVAAADVEYLGEDPARAPDRIAGRSTRERVAQALGRVARRAGAGDQVWVVLIGHGSAQGEVSRFNLPGPDLTAEDFARLLQPLARQRVAFVNAASASGDFAKALAAEGRAIVTATKSPSERNATMFATHFAAALAEDVADVDKDGRVTLLEAFAYAKREVARKYESENRLLTEHAQLEDDGDGVASDAPSARAKDGRLAATLALGVAGAGGAGVAAGPVTARERELVDRVAALRARKATMDSTTYEAQLETVLVEPARASRASRGGSPAAPSSPASPAGG
ncbi:hypothetical protein, partial [Roseisolibacter sp. H3M3-2]|uniref:hypothetical protein n=1 Tax=Roseisolibacter sp. H3M3-2 TaxID=3031323 RepID=UPI0023DA0EBD